MLFKVEFSFIVELMFKFDFVLLLSVMSIIVDVSLLFVILELLSSILLLKRLIFSFMFEISGIFFEEFSSSSSLS